MSFDPTIDVLKKALDVSLMRQTAIAHNIANSNTLNYETIEVNFEQQIHDSSTNDLSDVTPLYQLSDHHSSIDEQMALNVQNITHYRALVKGLNQKFAIMKLALQGTN